MVQTQFQQAETQLPTDLRHEIFILHGCVDGLEAHISEQMASLGFVEIKSMRVMFADLRRELIVL